jgi:hypothetical protein
LVEGGGLEERSLEWQLAGQEFLGERWPLIGKVGFGADEDDPPCKALLAQCLRPMNPGVARADDEYCVRQSIPLYADEMIEQRAGILAPNERNPAAGVRQTGALRGEPAAAMGIQVPD